VNAIDIENAIREHFPRIHRAALVLTGNPWDADDLAQETFLVFSSQADRFEGRSSLYTWLYGILLNLERRDRRNGGLRRAKLKVLQQQTDPQRQTVPAAETSIVVAEWKQSLWAWVEKLPNAQRQTLVLRFSEGLRYEDIASVLACPVGTVKSRIFNGLAGLRTLMQEAGEEVKLPPAHTSEDLKHAI
jgi:RNA polymerase sigma-70 factor (ECF subfamily)